MTFIQVLLIASILILTKFYTKFFKNRLIERVIFILILLTGMVAVLFPEITNIIANFVGVGRGVDLLTYILAVVFYGSFYFLYTKIALIEKQQTQIIRKIALLEIVKANEKKE